MWSYFGLAVAGLLVVGAGIWAVLVVSMRAKYSPVLTAIRRMNRRFANPRVMRTAGRPGAAASVIRHVGRFTARRYETPVGVVAAGTGFVIALPYGTSPDWVKNLHAAGAADIVTDGRTYRVGEVQVVSAAAVDEYFSLRTRLAHRLYGVDQFLWLERIGSGVPAGELR